MRIQYKFIFMKSFYAVNARENQCLTINWKWLNLNGFCRNYIEKMTVNSFSEITFDAGLIELCFGKKNFQRMPLKNKFPSLLHSAADRSHDFPSAILEYFHREFVSVIYFRTVWKNFIYFNAVLSVK